MVINPIIGFYIPIIRISIKGGMTIPNIATFDHGTHDHYDHWKTPLSLWLCFWSIHSQENTGRWRCIVYLEPVCPLFWWFKPPKQGLFYSFLFKTGVIWVPGIHIIRSYFCKAKQIQKDENNVRVLMTPAGSGIFFQDSELLGCVFLGGQLMINWWFGTRWSGIRRVPWSNNPFHFRGFQESKPPNAPNQQSTTRFFKVAWNDFPNGGHLSPERVKNHHHLGPVWIRRLPTGIPDPIPCGQQIYTPWK